MPFAMVVRYEIIPLAASYIRCFLWMLLNAPFRNRHLHEEVGAQLGSACCLSRRINSDVAPLRQVSLTNIVQLRQASNFRMFQEIELC